MINFALFSMFCVFMAAITMPNEKEEAEFDYGESYDDLY